MDGRNLTKDGGLDAFEKLGFGVLLSEASKACCDRMAEPFEGDDPPANVRDWGFVHMAKFDDEDLTHENYSKAAAGLSTGSAASSAQRPRRTEMPQKDQRGFVDLWSAGEEDETSNSSKLNHRNGVRLRQGGGITPVGESATPCGPMKRGSASLSAAQWIHPYISTDEGCRAIVRQIGETIGGHRAGRDPGAIIMREGAENQVQPLHTDFHVHDVSFVDDLAAHAFEPMHPDGWCKWLCEARGPFVLVRRHREKKDSRLFTTAK